MRYCYSCGEEGHFGDDCEERRVMTVTPFHLPTFEYFMSADAEECEQEEEEEDYYCRERDKRHEDIHNRNHQEDRNNHDEYYRNHTKEYYRNQNDANHNEEYYIQKKEYNRTQNDKYYRNQNDEYYHQDSFQNRYQQSRRFDQVERNYRHGEERNFGGGRYNNSDHKLRPQYAAPYPVATQYPVQSSHQNRPMYKGGYKRMN